uniref:Homocysteine-responsive endoplasmic reticulum-resident ubiquitin-like domain member 2 protein n=1 Tax=Eptatretus burgeri TaxID=7764 RepID=A0A8C4QKU6_EPTBU
MDSAPGLPITVLIKAPNQKYADQNVECFLEWTVHKLKSHLSSVYPSHPSTKEQRLIYSGRLLSDGQQLKDVLRKHDEFHTVHLVCPSPSPPTSPQPAASPSGQSPSLGGYQSTDVTVSSTQQMPSTLHSSTPWLDGTDGLTERRSLYQMPVSTNRSGPMVQPAVTFPTYHMYMMWLQQFYAQQYYAIYQAAANPSTTSLPMTPALSEPLSANAANQPMAPEPNNARAGNRNVVMNAQGGPAEDEDDLNRDWLDWVFTASRATVLLSIFYFYSSVGRFLMVSGALLLLYMYQGGLFPFQRVRGVGRGAEENIVDEQQELREMEQLMDDGVEGDTDSGDDDSDSEGDDPGFFTSAWTCVMTFFTSLVPEGPAQLHN